MFDAFAERRDYVVDRIARINELPVSRPQGAFYTFFDPDGMTDEPTPGRGGTNTRDATDASSCRQ